MDYYIIWLIIIIASLIVEAITMGLTSIWFAPAALITMLLSFTGVSIWIQVTVFIVLSSLMLIFLYPLAKKKLKIGHVKTNYEMVIGKEGVVVETIDNIQALGQVKVQGQIWTARSQDDTVIKKGTKITVREVKGVKLIVEKID